MNTKTIKDIGRALSFAERYYLIKWSDSFRKVAEVKEEFTSQKMVSFLNVLISNPPLSWTGIKNYPLNLAKELLERALERILTSNSKIDLREVQILSNLLKDVNSKV